MAMLDHHHEEGFVDASECIVGSKLMENVCKSIIQYSNNLGFDNEDSDVIHFVRLYLGGFC